MKYKHIQYTEHKVIDTSEYKTYPQIFIDKKCIGGYNIFKKYVTPTYDFKRLEEVSGQLVRNLNKAIDINLYPVPETKYSNMKHRPLGIGVQGLADVFCMMRFPFDSREALELNEKIFETMYYGAMKSSMELAKVNGPYESFRGSPLSKGLFQFNLWDKKDSTRYDWNTLRQNIIQSGVRNSLLIACIQLLLLLKLCGIMKQLNHLQAIYM